MYFLELEALFYPISGTEHKFCRHSFATIYLLSGREAGIGLPDVFLSRGNKAFKFSKKLFLGRTHINLLGIVVL
jgi:hypothetical protein